MKWFPPPGRRPWKRPGPNQWLLCRSPFPGLRTERPGPVPAARASHGRARKRQANLDNTNDEGNTGAGSGAAGTRSGGSGGSGGSTGAPGRPEKPASPSASPPPHGDGGALHAPSTLTRDGAGGFWRHVSAPVSHGVSSFLHSCGPRACRSSRGNTRQNQARPTIRTQSELCARSPVRPDVAFTAASPLRQRRTSFRSLESAPYVG